MNATPEQLHAAGSAARDLLRFALTRQPRIGLLVITGITSVAKTLRSDVAASTDLLRRLIEPEHLREHGHEELRWLTMNIQSIIENNPDFAVDIFQAIYAYDDTSNSKTSIGDSNILKLTSNRRQDYQSAWYLLAESIPGFLEKNLVSATRAVARSLAGYVQRTRLEPYGKDLTYETFSIGPMTAKFVSDTSYAWYRSGGYKPVQDAPVVLTKFEAYLAKIALEPDSTIKLQQILTVLAAESGLAVLWASLILVGAGHPERFASSLMPLALAEPMMLSEDTRYQLGQFIKSAYPHLGNMERAAIEHSILSLSGKLGERSKSILAGCIPNGLIATDAMSEYLAALRERGESRPNMPALHITSSTRVFDTDRYLESKGVSLDEPDNSSIRELMRRVEELDAAGDSSTITLTSILSQIPVLEELRSPLASRFEGKIPLELSETAAGILAVAAARLSRAPPLVIESKIVRQKLKRILLFCASSSNPNFNAEEEDSFHENLSWGGPSARASAAVGLLDLVRSDQKSDRAIVSAIRKLARDPVAHVRYQIIRNLALLRNLELKWVCSEIEHVLSKEPTRGVVSGALEALGNIGRSDLPLTLRLAKLVLHRYGICIKEVGMNHCRQSATALIFDIHITHNIAEADEFVLQLIAETITKTATIRNFIARYSDNLLLGQGDNPQAPEHEYRRKVFAFYSAVVERAFKKIEELSNIHDVRSFASWPADAQDTVRSMFGLLDEVAMRLYFASGARHGGAALSDVTPEQARFYREARPLFGRLASAIVAPIAHHLIQMLEAFVSLDPAGVFTLIAQSVRSSEQGGYGLEKMAADLIVRIVERYLADYRSVFADSARLKDLMDCLDVFVRAGWPSAQSLTFRLGEIWR